MPIVSSSILRVINKQNGISVYEQHTDHVGKIHDYRYRTTADADQAGNLAQHALDLDVSIKDSEANTATNDSLSGADPATMTFDHLTDAESVRARMEAFLTGQATQVIHMLAWVQSFSTPDLNGLGFTSAERGQINAREGTIDGVKSLLETDSFFILGEF